VLWPFAFADSETPSPLCGDGLAEILKKNNLGALFQFGLLRAHQFSWANMPRRGKGDQEAPCQVNGNVETENAEDFQHSPVAKKASILP
jgi:hypothetical protein